MITSKPQRASLRGSGFVRLKTSVYSRVYLKDEKNPKRV